MYYTVSRYLKYAIFVIVCGAFLQAASGQPKDEGSVRKQLAIYALQGDAEPVELTIERAFINNEVVRGSPGGFQDSMAVVKLPGPKANFRFKGDTPVEFLAKTPPRFDPRQLELFRFETRGKQRTTYL